MYKIIFLFWFASLIIWNYCFPDAQPWEDVFVGVCDAEESAPETAFVPENKVRSFWDKLFGKN